QVISLSDEDVDELRAELAAGRPPMVWFTPAAVGVAAGGSAKIVAFADTEEGDFVQVRPTGSKDVLSFSPSELPAPPPPAHKAPPHPTTRSRAPRTAPTPTGAPPPQPAPPPGPRRRRPPAGPRRPPLRHPSPPTRRRRHAAPAGPPPARS